MAKGIGMIGMRAMMRLDMKLGGLLAMASAMALAACGPAKPAKLPPPPPPPPPPKAIVIPPKPYPPNNSSPVLTSPKLGSDGLYVSPNRNITTAQTTWNLRAAYNVAALNCFGPANLEILPSYKLFLKAHAKGLTAANRKVDTEFKGKYGTRFIPPREKYMTEVYNHFAMPPTLPHFCEAVVAMSKDAKLIKPAELDQFSARVLPSIEIVFDDFYRRYDKYKLDLDDWNSKFGPLVQTK